MNGDGTLADSTADKATSDLLMLGIMDEDRSIKRPDLAEALVRAPDGRILDLAPALEHVPGGALALTLLKSNPIAKPSDIGAVLRDAYGLPWAPATVATAGARFRAWARLAGVHVQKIPRKLADS
jgi:hypothetical protein